MADESQSKKTVTKKRTGNLKSVFGCSHQSKKRKTHLWTQILLVLHWQVF
jgi:hypothetical protein